MTVELYCPTCGSNRFAFPDDDKAQVLCQVCGTSQGSYAELIRRVSDQVTRAARR